MWNRQLSEKQQTRQAYEGLLNVFGIKQDFEHYGEIILNQMIHNLELFLANNLDEAAITHLLDQIINVCLESDKMENAQ